MLKRDQLVRKLQHIGNRSVRGKINWIRKYVADRYGEGPFKRKYNLLIGERSAERIKNSGITSFTVDSVWAKFILYLCRVSRDLKSMAPRAGKASIEVNS